MFKHYILDIRRILLIKEDIVIVVASLKIEA